MTNARFRRLCGACVAAALMPGTAFAATQGTLGATSTGSITIGASIPNRVQLSKLTDVSFTNQDPSVDASSAQDVCVWSNTSTRGYTITATGSGAGNAFTLASGALPAVPYSVEWAPSSGQTAGTVLAAGSTLTGQTSTATNSDCSAGPAASAGRACRFRTVGTTRLPAGRGAWSQGSDPQM